MLCLRQGQNWHSILAATPWLPAGTAIAAASTWTKLWMTESTPWLLGWLPSGQGWACAKKELSFFMRFFSPCKCFALFYRYITWGDLCHFSYSHLWHLHILDVLLTPKCIVSLVTWFICPSLTSWPPGGCSWALDSCSYFYSTSYSYFEFLQTWQGNWKMWFFYTLH